VDSSGREPWDEDGEGAAAFGSLGRFGLRRPSPFAMPRCLGRLVLVSRGAFRWLGLGRAHAGGHWLALAAVRGHSWGRGEWALLGFIGQCCGIAHQPAAYILLHKQV